MGSCYVGHIGKRSRAEREFYNAVPHYRGTQNCTNEPLKYKFHIRPLVNDIGKSGTTDAYLSWQANVADMLIALPSCITHRHDT